MKPEILHNDHMMFLDRALETQRTALLTAMADAVSERRKAASERAKAAGYKPPVPKAGGK